MKGLCCGGRTRDGLCAVSVVVALLLEHQSQSIPAEDETACTQQRCIINVGLAFEGTCADRLQMWMFLRMFLTLQEVPDDALDQQDHLGIFEAIWERQAWCHAFQRLETRILNYHWHALCPHKTSRCPTAGRMRV